MADDQLIIGHRNSEWTGIGPFMEEDIAFSSIAQDKIGQSLAIYNILHEQLGEADPDTIAFTRDEKDFKCCHLVEYPIGEYEFSLMRNFLFAHAEYLRFEMLSDSSYEPLTKVAKKFKGEVKYHIMHGDNWVTKLGNANDESHSHMQSALNDTFNLALGIFEPGEFENQLIEMKVFAGEEILKGKWMEIIKPILEKASLKLPSEKDWQPAIGGRKGYHTEFLKPLLEEMSEVFRIDIKAEW
jgi:ring-1,2-phenylacetyl-CoA epoxidase subunit PaaC